MNKVHVKTGDTVVILSGKDKGKKGKVLEVSPKEGKVIVEGLNIATKHVKPRRQGEQGGIVEDTAFEDVVTVKMRIPQELEPAFEARLVDLSNGTCRGEITDTVFADID